MGPLVDPLALPSGGSSGSTISCDAADCSTPPAILGADDAFDGTATERTFVPVQSFHNDVVALADEYGALVESYRYDVLGGVNVMSPANPNPWGAGAISNGLGRSANGNTMLWAGAHWSSDLGLYDMRLRQYDPALGVFLSRDPLGYVDSFDEWLCAGGDSLNLWDAFGLASGPQGGAGVQHLRFEPMEIERRDTYQQRGPFVVRRPSERRTIVATLEDPDDIPMWVARFLRPPDILFTNLDNLRDRLDEELGPYGVTEELRIVTHGDPGVVILRYRDPEFDGVSQEPGISAGSLNDPETLEELEALAPYIAPTGRLVLSSCYTSSREDGRALQLGLSEVFGVEVVGSNSAQVIPQILIGTVTSCRDGECDREIVEPPEGWDE